MHVREIGMTGVEASVLGIGSSSFRHGTPEVCAHLLEQACELGITYYDTARSYVNGEEAIGCLPAHVRNELVVATKTGARGGGYCVTDLQRSLNTMKRGHIDVWMTHMMETEEEYDLCTSLGGFCDIGIAAREAGMVRAIGASFHAPTELIQRAIRERAFDVVMFQLNLIGRETVFGSSTASYRERLLPAARENGVGVVVMKVLAGGEMRHGAPKLTFAAERESGRSVQGGAVRWATMHPGIATAVVGMATTDELVQNVAAVEGVDDGLLGTFEDWEARAAAMGAGECTRCGECLDCCPSGIEIPKIMRLFDQDRFFGMTGVARHKYAALEVNGAACERCERCLQACPEDFVIGDVLEEAHGALEGGRR